MSWLWLSSVVLLTAAELNKVIKDASPVDKSPLGRDLASRLLEKNERVN
jgi:hypothetical protein